MIAGKIVRKKKLINIDIEKIVRETILKVGYDNDSLEFNGNNVKIDLYMNKQSSDIACGVNNSLDEKELEFSFSDRIAPIVLKNKKNNNYTHIIMPLNS